MLSNIIETGNKNNNQPMEPYSNGVTNDTTNDQTREISRNNSDGKILEYKSKKQSINQIAEVYDKSELMKYLEHINSTTVSNCNGEVNCSIIKNDVDNFSQS